MPSAESNPLDLKTLAINDDTVLRPQLAGKGNLLAAVRQPLQDSASQLRRLFNLAPSLRQTLHDKLQTHLQMDPTHCGLRHADSQVTLLTFAARLMASPVAANAFMGWSTWGFADTQAQARMSAADWARELGPRVTGTNLQAQRDYWEARMPGTFVSRHAHACELLRQHFSNSLNLAYGLGSLDTQRWLQGREAAPNYAQLQWRLPAGTKLTSTFALLIAPQTGQTGWLAYLPSLSTHVLAFDDLKRLRSWVFENRFTFWSDPRSPLTDGSLDDVLITELQTDGFAALIEETQRQQQEIADHHLHQICLQSETGPLDWSTLQAWEAQRQEIVRQNISATLETSIEEVMANDSALAEEEIHFACLPTHLPVGWREQQVERQEALLEAHLDGESDPSSTKLSALREHQTALDQLQDAQDIDLLELAEPVTADSLQAHLATINQRLVQALLLEARIQHALGELSDAHLEWVEQLVERPGQSLQRSVQACALELVSGDRTWPLNGYMTFRALPEEDEEDPLQSVLLYRPGQRGGLMAFEDEAALVHSLQLTLHGAWPDALLETATLDDTQLQALLTQDTPLAFNHPVIVSDFMEHCVGAIVTALPAETSRELARQRLCVSENRARAVAFARLAQANRSSHIQEQLAPLQHLGTEQLAELATEVDSLRSALHASADLLTWSLPSRSQFTLHLLNDHLRKAFGVPAIPRITLDIADSVTLKKVVSGQSGMGAASRDVPVFSETRHDIALEAFMLTALDDSRRLRLANAKVKLDPANPVLERELTSAYLASLITELDTAGRYETRIVNAYLGFAQETAWQAQWRQETLRRPYEHRLRLLALSRPSTLDADGQRLLETFCREQVDASVARTITYHTLELRPGIAADGSTDRVGLSGITVINEEHTPVLLYLPEAPNGQVISQYPSPGEACEALQDMALDPQMARYLADKTQSGTPGENEKYIEMALANGFRSFIALGSTRTESLPTYESRLEMGELLRSHRDSSRSQADMALAAPEVFDHYFFLGLRLALGMVPGAGTALSLYDGWQAATAAVKAFGNGSTEAGLQHLVSLLQSLSDAILTLAPLASNPGQPASTAHLLTRQRQRQTLLTPVSEVRKTPPSPFIGYEAELPAGPMLRSTLAQGAGVFEHTATQQHYILRSNTWYAVDWDPTYATWRLKPQGLRTYRQPVRLSEQGAWETPGRLNGLLVDNGLQGGGGVLTTLYDQGIAYWRQLLRRQPRQLTGIELAHDINDELVRIRARLQTKHANYRSALQAVVEGAHPDDAQRVALAGARQQLNDEFERSIEFNSRSIARLQEQRATLKRTDYATFKSLCEANISEMSEAQMRRASERLVLSTQQSELASNALQALQDTLPSATTRKRVTQDSLLANQEVIATLTEIERLAIRHHARCKTLQGKALTEYLQRVSKTGLTLDITNVQLLRASFLSMTLLHANAVEHFQASAFLTHFIEHGAVLQNTLYSHFALPKANLSRTQERNFLSSAQRQYARFLSHLTAWEDNFHDLLAPNEVLALRQLLRKIGEEIEATLDRAAATAARQRPATRPGPAVSRPRLFETVEGPMIGREHVEGGQLSMRINQPHSDRPHRIYVRNEANLWQPSTPERAAPTETLQQLVDSATARLDDLPKQQAKLRQYQTPEAIPVDLEDIAQGHAEQLRFIAGQVRRKAGSAITAEQHALTQRLDAAAGHMQTLGRQLRTAQTKATGKPTVAHLHYLLEQQAVEVAWSRILKPKLDRQGNPAEYLEEYLVRDRATQSPLWYAHFHFRKRPTQGFNRLEAGHLKLASERDLGAGAWRGSMSETQANQLFGNLRPPA
ncbi:dermonecrotic toxin domain-containing protein [Pseudomonas sp. NY15463]|uniref:dermonecrotic toxin domain-containing protein n=1 Tax=Pseudomonas sp. NY15463 TaxID=3400361 RepID=UPI003A864611